MALRGRCGLVELFLLTNFLSAIKGEPRLIGSLKPVVGLVGHYVILPCSLQPAESVTERTVEWTKSNLSSIFVHIFRQGRFLYDQRDPSYSQRTSLFEQELKNGNMSLKLSDLTLSDKGTYTCKLVPQELETSIQVLIGSVSKPIISHEKIEGTTAVLKCDAKNWYPKPEMEWRDKEGRIIPPDHNNTVNETEHFSICSRITVEITANDTYTCTVRQQDINQSRETSYTPYVYREIVWMNAVAAIVTSCLMFIVVLILMYNYGERLRCVRKTADTGETDETDGLRLQDQVTHLQRKNERLEMEVCRLKEELEKYQRENQRHANCSDVTADKEPQPNSPGNQLVQRCLLWCGNNLRN